MSEELVLIRGFSDAYEAELARELLESGGIYTEIRDAHTISINWFFSNAIGGVKLFVRKADAERAQEVLSASKQSIAEALKEEEAEVCPGCGKQTLRDVQVARRFNFLAFLILGFPVRIPRLIQECSSCGKLWREVEENG